MPFKSEKQRKWMHANEPEMADKWEKEESIKGKLRNLIKQEIKSINEGFDKYHLGGLLDSKLKKRLERAIKIWGGKVDAVGNDYIKFRLGSFEVKKFPALLKKLDRNKNVWIGDKRKNNIWDRRRNIDKLGEAQFLRAKQMVFLPDKKMYYDPMNDNLWLMGPYGGPDLDDDPIEPRDRDYKKIIRKLSSKDKSVLKKAMRTRKRRKEATTSVSVPGYLTPVAFKKSTQKAIDTDDEDDEKSESMAAPFRRRNSRGLGRPMKVGLSEELQNSQGEQTDFKKGDLVKDINPDCPHHGSEGEVTKVGKGTITFDVTNNGKNYQQGDELEKTVDQMVKLKESVNEGKSKPSKGDYVKTIFGIAQIEKIRGSIAFMKLPGKKTKGYWMNDIKNLKSTDKMEKGKTLWTESVNEAKPKSFKFKFQCMECGKSFIKSLKRSLEVKCPKCKSVDIELENINEDHIKFSKEEMAQLHKDGKLEKGGHTIEFGESINESDLGLTYKKGKTVKVTHKKSGKELIIIDKPNVKREYEKIGYFAEGQVNESIKPQGYSQLNRAARTLPSDIKDFLKALKKQDDDAVEREILYLKAEFDTFAHMLKDKKYTESINESPMAPFSSQEARAHINSDIKDMSKHLGKASQQVIKIMMDGVRKGKYTAMDISRGIKEGPARRTHFGEMTFIQSLWSKMREKFRRYSKDRKLS